MTTSHNKLILPDYLVVKDEEEKIPFEERAKQLPHPSGYRILCAIPEIEETFDGTIAKSTATLNFEMLLTTVLFVMRLGPECYTDKGRFPNGPWCKEGDFVLVKPNSGSRVKIHGTEFRIINDDSVEALVQDPRGYSRA